MKKLFTKKNRLIAILLAVCLMATVLVPVLHELGSAGPVKAATTMEAIPTNIGRISAKNYGAKAAERIDTNIPIYAIQQANGYYANYMKLRDIAYYLDFDVVWSADEPNAMRLYTNKHYLDNWTAPGPATEQKVASPSTMDIYVDDVKVTTGVQPVMISYNNYFKVRDIAKIMDFWCEFGVNSSKQTYVFLDNNYHYVDEAELNAGAKQSPQYAKTIQYQPLVWYDGNIGAVSDTPVTYSLRDAWGNYDYTKLYLGYTNEGMNAVAQLMLDRNTINKDNSGVKQFSDGNKLNAYYRYPMIEFTRKNGGDTGLLRYDDVLGDIGAGKVYSDSNFGVNLAIRSIGAADRNDKTEAGVLSVEYDTDGQFAKAREVTLQANTVQRILERMNTLSCDEEKVQFLATCVDAKMQYGLGSSSLEIITEKAISNGYWEQGTEFSRFSASSVNGTNNYIGFENIGNIWADDKVYVGVCNDFSFVFENLCNAAGYYYVPITPDNANHIWDAVWLTDEGCWTSFDASGGGYQFKMYRDKKGWWYDSGDGHRTEWNSVQNDVMPILDFFYMMEQIKPGGWLSSDVTQNP